MAYCTATDVTNQTVINAITQANWSNPGDINLRIAEGDTRINAKLMALGYGPLPFSSVPLYVFEMSKAYARYAILRDAYANNSPSSEPAKAQEEYKADYSKMMLDLENGEASLLDTGNNLIDHTMVNQQVTNVAKTNSVLRALTMDEPESLGPDIDSSYTADNVKGV